ncbi:hypothetical protein GB928_020760 [Shinella curvata]|uniref:YpeB-like protein with protease inhibitory function n=1 Tax=Shinella curvata TaxID=1817964 RepID=A0ABT8XIV1_9HYPH|nr:hypothetical protein [Shinella curvata]MCJ8052551.1 hypothetical protein [Shinella curvata]MDO6123631.1 hypothetical protein [Shinella curvata]
MTSFLKKTVLAALLGLGALTAVAPAASAGDINLSIEQVGYRNGFFEVHDYGRDRDRWDRRSDRRDRWDRRHERRHGDWGRRGRCSPDFAVAKARDLGLRRARLADVTPRKVVVEGFRYGGYSRVVFANDRHCPVLWR